MTWELIESIRHVVRQAVAAQGASNARFLPAEQGPGMIVIDMPGYANVKERERIIGEIEAVTSEVVEISVCTPDDLPAKERRQLLATSRKI